MKNNGVRFIAEMGIFIALGLVFDFLASIYSNAIWPMGGSISLVMIPIFMMSFRYGLKGGLVSGIAVGSIQMLWAGGGIVHWSQALLDYSVAYGLVGLAGVFARKISRDQNVSAKKYFANAGILIGGTLRTVAHIISGYIFFGEWVGEGFEEIPLTWSIIYNLGYMVPTIIISMIVITVIISKYYQLVEYVEV